MNNSSGKPLGIDVFEQLIDEGNYTGFMTGIKALDRASTLWAEVQVMSLEILQIQGNACLALQRATELKHILQDSNLKQQAELTFLYLDWLFNGRSTEQKAAVDLACIEVLSQTTSNNLWLSTKELQLKLRATTVMLGLNDPETKSKIAEDYLQLINLYEESGSFQKAYLCVVQLIKLQLSKPLFSKARALRLLQQYEKEQFVKTVPFRLASIRSMIAEILFEDVLMGKNDNDYKSYFKSAMSLFRLGNNKAGQWDIWASKGRLWLKYGHSQGKVLLDRAIRGYESQGHAAGIISACTSVMQWLHKTGRLTAVASYQQKIYDNQSVFNRVPQYDHSEQTDLVLKSNHVLAQTGAMVNAGRKAEATALLKQGIAEVFPYGETLPLANLQAALGLMSDNQIESEKLIENALKVYTQLGFYEEALVLIHNRMNGAADSVVIKKDDALIRACLQGAQSLISGRPTLEFAEKLAACYEAAAGIYINMGYREKGLSKLRRAAGIYAEYDLKPFLAFNLTYQGICYLENNSPDFYTKMCRTLNEAYALFKLMNYVCGMWFTQLSLARAKLQQGTMFLLEAREHSKKAEEIAWKLRDVDFAKFKVQLSKGTCSSIFCHKLLSEYKAGGPPISTPIHFRDH